MKFSDERGRGEEDQHEDHHKNYTPQRDLLSVRLSKLNLSLLLPQLSDVDEVGQREGPAADAHRHDEADHRGDEAERQRDREQLDEFRVGAREIAADFVGFLHRARSARCHDKIQRAK